MTNQDDPNPIPIPQQGAPAGPDQSPPTPPPAVPPSPPAAPAPQARPTNGLAIAGFVLSLIAILGGLGASGGELRGADVLIVHAISLVLALLALIFSILGLRRARRTKRGRGLALAGVIISSSWVVLGVLCPFLAILVFFWSDISAWFSELFAGPTTSSG